MCIRDRSYATYLKCEGKDYKSENLPSLSGVYQPKKEIKESKIPIALTTFLKANPHIKTIFLHLDNDKTGRLCTCLLYTSLPADIDYEKVPGLRTEARQKLAALRPESFGRASRCLLYTSGLLFSKR